MTVLKILSKLLVLILVGNIEDTANSGILTALLIMAVLARLPKLLVLAILAGFPILRILAVLRILGLLLVLRILGLWLVLPIPAKIDDTDDTDSIGGTGKN